MQVCDHIPGRMNVLGIVRLYLLLRRLRQEGRKQKKRKVCLKVCLVLPINGIMVTSL